MDNFVEDNYEDKYNTKNPISKILMNNFLKCFTQMLDMAGQKGEIKTICEIGVGEGELLKIVHLKFPIANLFATDLSVNEIKKAKANLQKLKVQYSVQNAEDLKEFKDSQFDLVICCEVLEHVKNPIQALVEIRRISKNLAILSVPNEPIWRVLNMARGKYLKDLGNTPGHLNHWGAHTLNKLIRTNKLVVVAEKYPFPWQMKLVRGR